MDKIVVLMIWALSGISGLSKESQGEKFDQMFQWMIDEGAEFPDIELR